MLAFQASIVLEIGLDLIVIRRTDIDLTSGTQHLVGALSTLWIAQSLKTAPIFLPSSALAPRMVSVSKTIAHTPKALAM